MHYRLIFDQVNQGKKLNSRKEPFKGSKIPKFCRETQQNTENIALQSSQIFYIFVSRVEIATIFSEVFSTYCPRSEGKSQ